MAQSDSQALKGTEKEKICWQCGRSFSTGLTLCPDDGARLIELGIEDREDPLVGTVFDGRFRIYKKLGEGGMGAVYSARRLDFETNVAIKLLKADLVRDEGIRKRFMYEARVISNLKHPHSVRLFDFGQTAAGHVYMVMELLEGESLADRLAYRFVTYREIFDIVPPICGVLGEAHLQGVIHRDLKPENIFLLAVDGNHEFPKLIDFGIAKHHQAETMTKSGTLWGTPAYMSPEQARGDEVRGPADIYAIGVILYELICGNLPFHASTQMGYAVKHINEEARHLSSIPGLESVPGELDDFILSMLAKNPEDRPPSMEVVASTLLRIRDEYFDDELLDSTPAHEVDAVALQQWIKDAPDISQPFWAAAEPIEELGATIPGEYALEASATLPFDSEELIERSAQATGVGEEPAIAAKAPANKSELKQREKRILWIGGAISGAALVVVALFLLGRAVDFDREVAETIPSTSAEPVERESTEELSGAISVGTMQAAQVIFEARAIVGELLAGVKVEKGEELDFLPLPEAGGEERTPPPVRVDEDARIREALEQTF